MALGPVGLVAGVADVVAGDGERLLDVERRGATELGDHVTGTAQLTLPLG